MITSPVRTGKCEPKQFLSSYCRDATILKRQVSGAKHHESGVKKLTDFCQSHVNPTKCLQISTVTI